MIDRDSVENYQNMCHSSLKDLVNTKDKERCLRFGKVLLSLNSYSKNISCQNFEQIFFNNLESSVDQIIENSCKNFKSSSNLNSNLYYLMSQNKVKKETICETPGSSVNNGSISQKLNDSLFKYQNPLLNSYLMPNCLNYSTFLFNLRNNPFLLANKNSLINGQSQ